MTSHLQRLQDLRECIPVFRCIPGCHDCCGPVTASAEEMSRLPFKSEAVRDAALAELSCPYLGVNGREAYGEPPLICKLFGTTPRLACPRGMRPDRMIDARAERKIHIFPGRDAAGAGVAMARPNPPADRMYLAAP